MAPLKTAGLLLCFFFISYHMLDCRTTMPGADSARLRSVARPPAPVQTDNSETSAAAHEKELRALAARHAEEMEEHRKGFAAAVQAEVGKQLAAVEEERRRADNTAKEGLPAAYVPPHGALTCENGVAAKTKFARRNTGAPMCTHPGDDGISVAIRGTGIWEGNILETLAADWAKFEQGTAPSSARYWFMDVGSNIGFFSTTGFTGTSLPVLSVEAAPWNYKMISQTRDYHAQGTAKPWIVENVALARQAGGELKFYGNSANFGGTTAVQPGNHQNKAFGKKADVFATVSTDTLDNVVARSLPEGDCVGVMKIDIEGFEQIALSAANDFMTTRPPCHIQQELHVPLLMASNSSDPNDTTHLELIKMLKAWGYRPRNEKDIVIKSIAHVNDVHWSLTREAAAKSKCACY
eukprot:TRINITY_DN798_c0_g1_i3.p1 TRINITY_DN798_c0_g1~~TRINITY_DN798_c0_g1_i3.p1  ORF type:complete len:408 (+),score=111.98 TRINITY_DN798_c0_g1_i3:54-1277(+)